MIGVCFRWLMGADVILAKPYLHFSAFLKATYVYTENERAGTYSQQGPHPLFAFARCSPFFILNCDGRRGLCWFHQHSCVCQFVCLVRKKKNNFGTFSPCAGCVLLPDLLFHFYMARCRRYFDTGKLPSIRVAVETKIHAFLCVFHLTAMFIISETSFHSLMCAGKEDF